jgi:6-phosphogluconolactonase
MRHELRVLPDADAVASAGADVVSSAAHAAVAARGRFTLAVSGGRSPWAMFARLAQMELPWSRTDVYQVDERVAPIDDADRNLAHLRHSLGDAAATIEAMPVESSDLDAAAAAYAARLPAAFDLIHLGLGPDGHTASLVPGDSVLEVTDRLVAPTGGTYQGRRRMTLTYPALARARQLLWLVTGADKHEPLARLLAGDATIPAGRVEAATSLVLADAAAGDETAP